MNEQHKATIRQALELCKTQDGLRGFWWQGQPSPEKPHEALERIDAALAALDALDTPQMPQAEVQRYSHRNGEMTPPEAEGWYWFKGQGHVRVGIERIHTAQSDYTAPVLASSDSAFVHDWIVNLSDTNGVWYGPIPAPQEADNE